MGVTQGKVISAALQHRYRRQLRFGSWQVSLCLGLGELSSKLNHQDAKESSMRWTDGDI